jgi:hypothetical protein
MIASIAKIAKSENQFQPLCVLRWAADDPTMLHSPPYLKL